MKDIIKYCILDRHGRVPQDVDYIQVRDKELGPRELLVLTRRVLANTTAQVLVNDRADVAMAAGAHGVHLRSNGIDPWEFKKLGLKVAVSCHAMEEVEAAQIADFIVFGPVFESPGKGTPVGLEKLTEAARASRIPVLALGGITWQNANACMEHGAAGIAGIRLFQSSEVSRFDPLALAASDSSGDLDK